MGKINLKSFRFYTDFRHKNLVEIDMRERLADMMYSTRRGAVCSVLCRKIVESDGEIEMNDLQEKFFVESVESMCSQNIIDAVHEALGIEDGGGTKDDE